MYKKKEKAVATLSKKNFWNSGVWEEKKKGLKKMTDAGCKKFFKPLWSAN